MFFRRKKQEELENLIHLLEMDMGNNYKDEAQRTFKKLEEKYNKLEQAGKLDTKQKYYYSAVLMRFAAKLQGYSHKDQKPDF